MYKQDTICAIATAIGGAIGIIRVSGPDAITITNHIFIPNEGAIPLIDRKSYTLTFGHIINQQGEIIDEVLISLFRAPHSYTGENSTEISCHGSPYILQKVMQLLIDNGCRTAKPGEYTQRAFLNGKMDLSQAEAVADLVAATSEAAHRLALNQMRGEFSNELHKLRNQLLHLTSLMELELDFSDHEELEFANRAELQKLATQIETLIKQLVDSFSTGNAIKNGVPVAIIGETNSGKSTLLNALIGEERAIISDIHGTTRDIIEDTINIQGITFRFIDTAGIRQTDDVIEQLGIERSFKALTQAQIIILMYDLQRSMDDFYSFYQKICPHINDQQIIIAMNKCDTVSNYPHIPPYIESTFPNCHVLNISAKQKTNINHLRQLLVELIHLHNIKPGNIIITNIRHYEALTCALASIQRVQEGFSTNLSSDFISQDLRECIYHLSNIIGEVTTDDVLKEIFNNFCIGK